MTRPLLLDLFCGAGGAAKGYHDAGFDVVGVDINPQPNYPYEFHQADAMTYPLDGFDAVHASPPCQAYSAMRFAPGAKEHPELVEPTRERLDAYGLPYVIENVVGAPLIEPIMLCGSQFGLGTSGYGLRRHRLFETKPALFTLLAPCDHSRTVIGIYGDHVRDRRRGLDGHEFAGHNRVQLARQALGIDWMDWSGLSQAIPPAYTQFIGEALLAAIGVTA